MEICRVNKQLQIYETFMENFFELRKRESLSPLSVLYITIYKRSGKREKVVNFINRIDKIN